MENNARSGVRRVQAELSLGSLKCHHYDQIFTSWFFRSITKNPMKEWKRRLPFANIWLVLEISKFEKCVKYANEMTDDVIYSTQYYLKYITRAIFANLQRRPLKLGRLIVLQETHLWLLKVLFPWQLTLFQSPPTWFQYAGAYYPEPPYVLYPWVNPFQ